MRARRQARRHRGVGECIMTQLPASIALGRARSALGNRAIGVRARGQIAWEDPAYGLGQTGQTSQLMRAADAFAASAARTARAAYSPGYALCTVAPATMVWRTRPCNSTPVNGVFLP